MNIQQIMSGVKSRSINSATATQLYATVSQLPNDTIGRNGTILDDLKVFTGRLEKCGTSAVLGHNNGATRVLEMHRCGGHKYCPVCADKVSGERVKKIDSSLRDNWDDARYSYMITFTLSNQKDLNASLKLLNKSYRAWYRAGQKRGETRSGGEAGKIVASSKSIEIKKGRGSNLWHCHIHAIVFTSRPLNFRVYDAKKKKIAGKGLSLKSSADRETFKKRCEELGAVKEWATVLRNGKEVKIPASKLSKEWAIATGGLGCGIDVRVLWGDDRPDSFVSLFDSIKGAGGDKTAKAVKYALKYSVKAGDLLKCSYEETFELFDGFRGIRSIEYAGFLRKTPVKSTKTKEEREAEEKQVKAEKRAELVEFCSGAEIEKIITVGDSEELEGVIGEPQAYALWTLGADIHREFQSKSSKRIAEYRKQRATSFDEYKQKKITGFDYIDSVKRVRNSMRRDIRYLVHLRNEEINDRSNGKYYEIIAETKENDDTWLKSIRGLSKEMRVSKFYNEDLTGKGLR